MMLAAELALARIDVAIVERRADQTVAGARAGGLHARTIEVLDQRASGIRLRGRAGAPAARHVPRMQATRSRSAELHACNPTDLL